MSVKQKIWPGNLFFFGLPGHIRDQAFIKLCGRIVPYFLEGLNHRRHLNCGIC
jgi:hypothetical protein